jgi:hypothetical protein
MPTTYIYMLEGPAKANAKNPDVSTVIVIHLSLKYLGRHLDFGGTFRYAISVSETRT